MMKKIIIGSLAFLLVSCASAVAGNLNNKKTTSGKSQLAFDATTSLSMMSSIQKNTKFLQNRAYNPTNEDIQELQDVLHQVDLILLNDSNFEVQQYNSDREEYKYKEVVTFKNFNNEETSYTLYYSQLNEKFKEDLFDDESETRTTINGIAILDGQEYSFKSITHIETEGKEVEEEYTFTLYKDSNSYVKINQEYEEERDELEKYYRYTIVDNGTKIYDYKLDYEKENDRKNETEINLTLNNFKYKIEEVKIEGITYLQVLVVEKDNMKLDSAYKVLFKKIISESGVSYELVE